MASYLTHKLNTTLLQTTSLHPPTFLFWNSGSLVQFQNSRHNRVVETSKILASGQQKGGTASEWSINHPIFI
jgi:hypothetical protein